MNLCACGCGSPVKGEWKRGHAARARLREAPQHIGLPGAAVPIFQDGTQPPQAHWWEHDDDQGPETDGGDAPWQDVEQDPPPSYASVDTAPISSTIPGPVTTAQKRDLAGKLALFFMIPYQGMSMVDPYCADALSKSMQPMIKALVPIIAGSPEAMKLFASGGPWLQWLNVAVAAKPLIEAVFAHHISHKVQTVTDEAGRKMIVETDYSQYAA